MKGIMKCVLGCYETASTARSSSDKASHSSREFVTNPISCCKMSDKYV